MILVAADPLDDLDVALARLDEAMLRICLLGDVVPREQRHAIRNDFAVVYAALVTHRRLHTRRSCRDA